MVLGAICLDFIDTLKKSAKKRLKGWVFTPLVTHEDCEAYHGGLLPVKDPPPNESPYDFYSKNPPTKRTFIKVKIPGRPLRLISLSFTPPLNHQSKNLTKPVVYLTFWRANGWVCHDMRIKRFMKHHPEERCPEGYHSLLTFRICQASKSSKKKRKVIHEHEIDFSLPDADVSVAERSLLLLEKSFEWRGRKSESFTGYQPYYLIVLEGDNYECEEHYL